MHKRRVRNLPRLRQLELNRQYPWLKKVHEGERESDVQVLSVSVFDHWLSREEANEMLENVSSLEQTRRDSLHADFCSRLVAETNVLSFAFRGRCHDRLVFREFTSATALASYCTPHGGRTLGHRQFHVVLPELGCAFYESWDDTNHFFYKGPSIANTILGWAQQSGLHVLPHG